MKIDPHLWEKISESLSSVLPITAIVLLLSITVVPLTPGTLVLFLFGALIVLSVVAGIVGLIVRRKSFGAVNAADDDIESMASKEAAYYVNNLIMVVFAVLLAYMTVSSALPSWLPFGGQSLSAGTYNAIARPLGIAYLAVLAICPLLGWRRTDKKAFWRAARVPGLCALVLFPGMPCIFYGTELPLDGGGDPDCRRTFDWTFVSQDKAYFARYKQILALKKELCAQTGNTKIKAENGVLKIVRERTSERITAVFNMETERSFAGAGIILYEQNYNGKTLGLNGVIVFKEKI